MLSRNVSLLCAIGLIGSPGLAFAQGQTLTIATVNNADMIIMQRLSPKWEQATGNKLNWVVLEENVLRQRATTDIACRLQVDCSVQVVSLPEGMQPDQMSTDQTRHALLSRRAIDAMGPIQ